jgi:REP element-mobilizing transposase RayT
MHCVFSPKDRLPLIRPKFRERLWAYMGGTARRHKMKALAAGGTENHAHILPSMPATMPVSDAVRR